MLRKFALAAVLSGLVQMTAHAGTSLKLDYMGEIVLPSGLRIADVEFGGISGLDYDPGTGVYYAISDDRSQKAPARFYTLKLAIDESGIKGIDIVSSHILQSESGAPFATGTIDPEAIRFDNIRNVLFWSSEGDADGKPALYEAAVDGKFIRRFAIPEAYLPDVAGKRGIRDNKAFEGLTLSTDHQTVWVSTENALLQDGSAKGGPSRIIGFNVESGKSVAEYAYVTGQTSQEGETDPRFNDNGLTEILEIDKGRFLTVERSYAQGIGNEINLYLAETAAAKNILGIAALSQVDTTPLKKTHLLKIGEGDFGLDVDNIESISLGPVIAGKQTLILASDNNFNTDSQFSQFLAFTLETLSQ